MLAHRLACLFAGLAVVASPASSQTIPSLPPASPWNVHYADDSCRLVRSFGEGDSAVSVIMDSFEPSDLLTLTFVGKPLKVRNGGATEAISVRFGPDAGATDISMFVGLHGSLPALIAQSGVRIVPFTEAEIEAARAAREAGNDYAQARISDEQRNAVEWLRLSGVLNEDFVLETGSLMKPLAALDKCNWDLIRTWGLDPEKHRSLLRKPVPMPGRTATISYMEYPSEMVRGGRQGTVKARLIVDAEGKVVDCRNLIATRDEEFGKLVCRKFRSMRFHPALDAQGNPMPSYYIQSVTFRME